MGWSHPGAVFYLTLSILAVIVLVRLFWYRNRPDIRKYVYRELMVVVAVTAAYLLPKLFL
jgi:hypothetical protein